MSYVYIVCDYHEHGSENHRATLDRALISEFLRCQYHDGEPRLRELLEKSDEDLAKDSPHNLVDGRCGEQLLVVKLQPYLVEE